MNTRDKPVAVIAGVGPGNGKAIARRYANAGYTVALLARSEAVLTALESEIAGAYGYPCDLTSLAQIEEVFTRIKAQLGLIDVLIYNAGSGVFKDVNGISVDDFEQAWRINALGALLCAQQVIPEMTESGNGSVVFIGATASRRGGVNSAAFAPAKAAQRSLAESMARALWPKGIHVALVILDGIVDFPRMREMFPNEADDFFIQPDGVAETVYQITQQQRSAWSFETEVRPFAEPW